MLHPGRSVRLVAVVLVVAAVAVLSLQAQRRGGGFRGGFGPPMPAASCNPYDGRLSLVRLWYANYPGWSYDYPDMEHNFSLILKDLTAVDVRPDWRCILRADDPELMKFPLTYLSEPGYWYPSDSEALGLRTYLAKGGFLIVDDFHFENEWQVFEAAMRKVLPDGRIERLTTAHPIYNTFFSIPKLEIPYPGRLGQSGLTGEFYGIYQDNDRSKRLKVVIDYNMDIGDYMEHSGTGFYLVDPTNEAFKFGVNYVIYGLTH
jgi:hypothetical protein